MTPSRWSGRRTMLAEWLPASQPEGWLSGPTDSNPMMKQHLLQPFGPCSASQAAFQMQYWAEVRADVLELIPPESGPSPFTEELQWFCMPSGPAEAAAYQLESPVEEHSGLQSCPASPADTRCAGGNEGHSDNLSQHSLSPLPMNDMEIHGQTHFLHQNSDAINCAIPKNPSPTSIPYHNQATFDIHQAYATTVSATHLFSDVDGPPPCKQANTSPSPESGHLVGPDCHSPTSYELTYPRRAQSLTEPLGNFPNSAASPSGRCTAPPFLVTQGHRPGVFDRHYTHPFPDHDLFQLDKKGKSMEYHLGTGTSCSRTHLTGLSVLEQGAPLPTSLNPYCVLPSQSQSHLCFTPNPPLPHQFTDASMFNGPFSSQQYHKGAQTQGRNSQQKVYPKPIYSYSCLIAMALKNSKMGSLPVSEIYNFMTENFPYFKTAPDGWKNSVRHNLSLNKCFEKIENKAGGSSRKGCLWTLNPAKVEKMDEEMQKWKRKDPLAIRRSMANPEALDRFVVDKLEKPESPKLHCHTQGAVTPPSGLAQTLSAPGRPSHAQFCAPLVNCNLSLESPSSTRASPQRDQIQRVDGSPIGHGHLNDNCDGLLEVDQGLEVDAINPSIMGLEIQGSVWEALQRESFPEENLPLNNESPISTASSHGCPTQKSMDLSSSADSFSFLHSSFSALDSTATAYLGVPTSPPLRLV
uniref:uncharacterized protein isoform X2 n=1 Tax=Myxine glutinosa TaxID=7769 RepID=UPI00358F3E22